VGKISGFVVKNTGHFRFDSIGLSFAVAEFRSGVFSGIFRQKSTKLDHISFGPIGLSFAVAETHPFPVWGTFRDSA
jgi:hypothetical protein